MFSDRVSFDLAEVVKNKQNGKIQKSIIPDKDFVDIQIIKDGKYSLSISNFPKEELLNELSSLPLEFDKNTKYWTFDFAFKPYLINKIKPICEKHNIIIKEPPKFVYQLLSSKIPYAGK